MLKRARAAFYGWRILAVSSITGAVGGGLTFFGFSVFFLPISESLKISRAAASLVFSLSRTEGAIEGPIAGYLIDKLGTRKVLFAAAAMMGIGYILLAKVDSFVTFLLVYLLVISFGFNAGVMHVPMAAVNTWFVRRRGLVVGILTASMGLGGAFIPPLLSLGIGHFGWRTTALLSGLIVLGILLPCSLVFRRSPESMGLLPDGDKARIMADTGPGVSSVPEQADFGVGQAMRTGTFWMMTIAMCLRMAAFNGLVMHFVAIMVWKGTDESEGAVLLGAMALLSVPLRLLIGWAGDRLPRSRIIAAACGAGVLAILFLQYAEPGWQLWMFVALITFPDAIGPISWSLIADFFGRQRYASIRGAMTAFTGIASAVIPVVAGILFDKTQSYELTLWIVAALLALSAIAFAILRPPGVKSPQVREATSAA
ncbi:MAG: MFS transporter [Dehalococcoidales bacterium]|nr:MFS transporter [Dehalococcoidales bacterium]